MGADWLAAVSGEAIFNDDCKWPRTCMSEAFPPWAEFPGSARSCSGHGSSSQEERWKCRSQGELSFELPFVLPHGVKEGIISVLCTSLSKTFLLILCNVLHNNRIVWY